MSEFLVLSQRDGLRMPADRCSTETPFFFMISADAFMSNRVWLLVSSPFEGGVNEKCIKIVEVSHGVPLFESVSSLSMI